MVIESTYNWYWLVDLLMDAGYRVHLAHPSAIKKYEDLRYSGDFADARNGAIFFLYNGRLMGVCFAAASFLRLTSAQGRAR